MTGSRAGVGLLALESPVCRTRRVGQACSAPTCTYSHARRGRALPDPIYDFSAACQFPEFRDVGRSPWISADARVVHRFRRGRGRPPHSMTPRNATLLAFATIILALRVLYRRVDKNNVVR